MTHPGGKRGVAVYGAANIDIQAACAGRYLPHDSNPGRSSISFGGVGRNIAENCARLGLGVELVTVIGDDDLSPSVRENCAQLGISLKYSLFLKNQATPRYICLMDSDGTLAGAVADMEALERFTLAEFEKRTEAGDNADIILIDANLSERVIRAACERWKEKPLFFEPVSVAKAGKAAGALENFSIVKPNLREAALLAGLREEAADAGVSAEGPDSPAAAEQKKRLAAKKYAGLLYKRGVKEVFVSLGPQGLLYFSGGECGIVKPLAMPVVNVSGAGDAACAGIIWASLADSAAYNTEKKARFAVAAASLCASSPDTVSKEMDEDLLTKLEKEVSYEPVS